MYESYYPGPIIHPPSAFFWRGRVLGTLCDCQVTWAWTFTGANPPAVIPMGSDVIVTAELQADSPSPNPVSTGTLTLTPTVTCGDSGPVELDPLRLHLS